MKARGYVFAMSFRRRPESMRRTAIVLDVAANHGRDAGAAAPRARPSTPSYLPSEGEVSLHSFGEIAKSTGRKPVPLEGLGRGSGGFANVVLVATEPPPLIPPLKGEGDDCEICTPHAFATARPQGMLTHLLGNRTYPCAHYPCIDPRQHAGPRVKAPKCEGGWAKNSPPPRFFGLRRGRYSKASLSSAQSPQ